MGYTPVSIEQQMKVAYLDYAMSVIVGRALPDVRDGLKPVQRRILYAMFREGIVPGKKYSKSAGVVGEVLKKYHPHGDSAVYDAMVRMAQDFNLRYLLVDGQGNYGSLDGDPAAAYRYTEARMSKIAMEMVEDIDKETVDFTPNFDETTEEPLVMPARIPAMLINGATGIAVGMATNIPPHNLGEIIDALVHLLDTPKATVEDLMTFVKGPDFPTGGIIYGLQGIQDAYRTGRGLVKVRARAYIERDHKGHESIIITEMPYQVNKASMVRKIDELRREKRVEGMSEVRDESDRDGIRVVVELKRGEYAQAILNSLYKHTQMETTFGVIMLALVRNQPLVLDLRQMLRHFLDHRREVVVRRTKFELRKARERAHILEGFKIALDNLDAVIALIRGSETPDVAKQGLTERFGLSIIQAQAILEMRLQRLTGLERDKILQEYKETLELIDKLKGILESEDIQRTIIRDELKLIRGLYADARRTEITSQTKELNIEDMIAEEEMVITVSHTGYIKRNPLSAYRSQRRGGKGLKGMETREEDFVEMLFIGNTHNYMLFFTNLGRVYWKKIYEIPEAGRTAKGKAMVNLLPISEGERVSVALPVKEFKGFLVQFTKAGIVKRTPLEEYSNPRSNGIIALTLKEGDELISVHLTDGTKDLIMGTKGGLAIRFNEEEVRSISRGGTGVIGIRLKDGDEVISAQAVNESAMLLTVTEKGLGKRTKVEQYPVQGRGGQGVISMKLTDRTGGAVGLMQVWDEDEVVLISNAGKIIRTEAKDISVLGRSTQGVILMHVGPEERVVSFGRVAEKD